MHFGNPIWKSNRERMSCQTTEHQYPLNNKQRTNISNFKLKVAAVFTLALIFLVGKDFISLIIDVLKMSYVHKEEENCTVVVEVEVTNEKSLAYSN